MVCKCSDCEERLKHEHFREIKISWEHAVNSHGPIGKETYHEACKKNILKYLDDERISEYNKKAIMNMFELGKEVGSVECMDLGKYINAHLDNNNSEVKRLEKRYKVRCN